MVEVIGHRLSRGNGLVVGIQLHGNALSVTQYVYLTPLFSRVRSDIAATWLSGIHFRPERDGSDNPLRSLSLSLYVYGIYIFIYYMVVGFQLAPRFPEFVILDSFMIMLGRFPMGSCCTAITFLAVSLVIQ